MGKILVIDDLRTLREIPDGCDVTYALTSKDGLAELRKGEELSELWLDHDLGYDMEAQDADTIRPIIDYLDELAFNDTPYPVGVILVHTMNSIGASYMVDVLSRRGYQVVRVQALEYFYA